MRARGFAVHAPALGEECARGNFIAPTLIEIGAVERSQSRSVRSGSPRVAFPARRAGELIDELNASGYALTGGVHSRIDGDDRSGRRASRRRQYLCQSQHHRRGGRRAAVRRPWLVGHRSESGRPALSEAPAQRRPAALAESRPARAVRPPRCDFANGWQRRARSASRSAARQSPRFRASASASNLPGPVGEQNVYSLRPRGAVLCHAASEEAAIVQIACALSAGNRALLAGRRRRRSVRCAAARVARATSVLPAQQPAHGRVDRSRGRGATPDLLTRSRRARGGRSPASSAFPPPRFLAGENWPLDWLMNERAVTVNTTAAGGNASLMSIG